MKSNLDLLLDHYNAEEIWLKTQLNQCTQEWDYIQAQAYANTLADVQHKLRVLHQLATPLTDEIKHVENGLEHLQRKIQRKAEGRTPSAIFGELWPTDNVWICKNDKRNFSLLMRSTEGLEYC